jgi:hypothetical protein
MLETENTLQKSYIIKFPLHTVANMEINAISYCLFIKLGIDINLG